MSAVDSQMIFWLTRTGKKIESLLPKVMHFVADMMTPPFDKNDTVHYTQMARTLKVGHEYAQRLLSRKYGLRAQRIAEILTENYPDHGFVIDKEECERIGLLTEEAAATLAKRDEAFSSATEGEATLMTDEGPAEIDPTENGSN